MSVSPLTGSRQEMNCPGRNAIRGAVVWRRKSERVSAPCSTKRTSCASYSIAMVTRTASLDLLVDRVAGDHDDDLDVRILDHRLAAEARGRRQARRLVEQVVLALLRRRELLE